MLEHSQLGKPTRYNSPYNPGLLFAIPRSAQRETLGPLSQTFYGVDIWNHYEISWLNERGKPEIALGEISYSAASPNIIESKSMKLYFNSFNATHFASAQALINTITKDLSQATGSSVKVKFFSVTESMRIETLPGFNLDCLDIACDQYQPEPELLRCDSEWVSETVYTHLLKSNCPITQQPDWGSLSLSYSGVRINHEGLLKYIISLRDHNEFHEHCVERVFCEVMARCQPQELTVFARYTRRGGIDINPLRTTHINFTLPTHFRTIRQ